VWTREGDLWEITGLGDLPGGDFSSEAWAVSADGTLIAGHSHSTNGWEACVWTRQGEQWTITPLGEYRPEPAYNRARALSADGSVVSGGWPVYGGDGHLPVWIHQEGQWVNTPVPRDDRSYWGYALSGNGSVLVGTSTPPAVGGGYEAWMGTHQDGDWAITYLGNLPGGGSHEPDYTSNAFGVSASGSVIVGNSYTPINGGQLESCVWTYGEDQWVISSLGKQIGNNPAVSVSADGSTLVGWTPTTNGVEACAWTFEEGQWVLAPLGTLPEGYFPSYARDTSADGIVIVGRGFAASGFEACLWTSRGTVGLGELEGGDYFSDALMVSADGSVIVGQSQSANGLEACVWTRRLVCGTPPVVSATGSGVFELGPSSSVTLGGEVADLDGDLLTYELRWTGGVLGYGTIRAPGSGDPVALPPTMVGTETLGVGVHTIELAVDDGTTEVTDSIEVEIIEAEAPTLNPEPSQSILWPIDHQMHTITIQANAEDNSGGPVTIAVEVSSDEPVDDGGDGATSPDWEVLEVDSVTGLIRIDLRAERSALGDGRTYFVTITATDAAGHESSTTIKITVPHDQRRG
jgi:uncharacterized membrane protein